MLRPALQRVVDELVARSAASGEVSLDEIGDGLGVLPVSQDEIEDVLAALERAGRRIVGPSGGGGEETLRRVLDAARAIRAETGRAPSPQQIAERTGVPIGRVRHALALARVMGR